MLSIFDDTLVNGEGETEEEAMQDHDVKIHFLMKRCFERNIKLNEEKAVTQTRSSIYGTCDH